MFPGVGGLGVGVKLSETLVTVTDCPQTQTVTPVDQKFHPPQHYSDHPSFQRRQYRFTGTPPTSHRPPNFTMSNVIVNVSSDLLWAITRNNSSYIVKRGVGNERVTFSKEPLNLTNKHSRKHSGLVNEKAVGVQANNNGGVTLITKKSHEKYGSKPASLYDTAAFSKNKSQRKTYAAIVNRVAKKHYRPDLRQEAVARASAIKRSQRPVKPTPASKLRGVKAKAAAEKA